MQIKDCQGPGHCENETLIEQLVEALRKLTIASRRFSMLHESCQLFPADCVNMTVDPQDLAEFDEAVKEAALAAVESSDA